MSRFDDARAKLKRSLIHFEELRTNINEYDREHSPSVYQEKEGTLTYYKVRISPEPTTHIALILGDWVHNLRSALDYATCAFLDHHYPNHPLDRVQFPFGRLGQKLNSSERAKLPADPEAVAVFENVRTAGGEYLDLLNEMSNQDKHRLLMAAVARQQKVEIVIDFAKNVGDIIVTPAIDTATWNTALKDGDVLVVLQDGSMGVPGIAFTYGVQIQSRRVVTPVDHLASVGSAVTAAVHNLETR